MRLTRELIDTPAPGHEPWCIVRSWERIVGRLLVADASSRISSCQEQVKMQEQLKQMQEHMQQGWQSVGVCRIR